MFELNFYIWFFSSWIYIGIILGYLAMKSIMKLVNNDDKKEDEKIFIDELGESCKQLGSCIGVSPMKMLFIFIYALCVLLWPYFLFVQFKKIFKRKK